MGNLCAGGPKKDQSRGQPVKQPPGKIAKPADMGVKANNEMEEANDFAQKIAAK